MGRPTGNRPQQNGKKFRRPAVRIAPTTSIGHQSNQTVYNKKWLLMADKERVPFADELFATTFSRENIEKLVTACRDATDAEVKESRRLLADDYVYSMHIISHRVPHVPVHLARILLPHSVDADDSNVCLFVKDLKRGRRIDPQPTIDYYENLLKQKKVTKELVIIPISQLYNEYGSFEMRRKLTFLYDRFLVDASLASHINGFLGPKLMAKCRSAFPINLHADDLPAEINLGLRRVFYRHQNSGVQKCVQIGRHSCGAEQMVDNCIDLLKQIHDIHPGGTKNIYKIFLKPNVNVSVSIPIYVNLEKPEDVVAWVKETTEKTKANSVADDSTKSSEETMNEDDDDDDDDDDTDIDASIVNNDVLIEENPNETATRKPKAPIRKSTVPRPAATVAAAAAPPVTEETINEMIVKNLKKVVGPNSGLSLNTQRTNSGGGGGVTKRTPTNGNRSNSMRSSSGAGGGGVRRGMNNRQQRGNNYNSGGGGGGSGGIGGGINQLSNMNWSGGNNFMGNRPPQNNQWNVNAFQRF